MRPGRSLNRSNQRGVRKKASRYEVIERLGYSYQSTGGLYQY